MHKERYRQSFRRSGMSLVVLTTQRSDPTSAGCSKAVKTRFENGARDTGSGLSRSMDDGPRGEKDRSDVRCLSKPRTVRRVLAEKTDLRKFGKPNPGLKCGYRMA